MKISVKAIYLGSMMPLLIIALLLLSISLAPYYLTTKYKNRLDDEIRTSIEAHEAAAAAMAQMRNYTNHLLEPTDGHQKKVFEGFGRNMELIDKTITRDSPLISNDYTAALKQIRYDFDLIQETFAKDIQKEKFLENYTRMTASLLVTRPPNRLLEIEKSYLNVHREHVRRTAAYLESNSRNSFFPTDDDFGKKIQKIINNYQQITYMMRLRILMNAHYMASVAYLYTPQASMMDLKKIRNQIDETMTEIEKVYSSAADFDQADELQATFFIKLKDEIYDFLDASEFLRANIGTSSYENLRKFAGDYLIDLNGLINQSMITESIARTNKDLEDDLAYINRDVMQNLWMAIISAAVIMFIILLPPIVISWRLIRPIVSMHRLVTARYKLVESEDKQTSVSGKDEVDELVQTFGIMYKEIADSRDEIVVRQSIASACSSASSVEQAAETCLELVSNHTNWTGGHIYLRNPESMMMTAMPLWYMGAEAKLRPLRDLIESQYTVEPESLVAKVMETKRPAWHRTILLNTKIITEQEALKHGIKGMIAVPVMVKGSVQGVLEFFSEGEISPNDRLLLLLVNTAIQLGRVIERQNWEGALVEAREEAEEANKAKSEFLTNMSHELRTPMHAILGFAKLAIKGIEKGKFPPEELKKHFANILTSGERLLGFLNVLLDLSKLESGTTVYDMKRNDMQKVVENVQREIQSLLDQKKITLEVKKSFPELSTEAVFDYGKLVQVILNLLSNAIKFSPEGKKIIITYSNAHVSLKKTVEEMLDAQARMVDALQVTVEDEGEGIPPTEVEYVFDKYMQSSRSIGKKEGTGLGLSICREIIKDHGGKIFAANRPEGGAIFTVQVPIEKLNVEEKQKQ